MIGLTGGIATGKSTVAKMFENLGATVVSADEVAHELMKHGGSAWHEIVELFGEGILSSDGEIDRRSLGDVVFGDAKKMSALESIIHPSVLQYLSKLSTEFKESGSGVLVLEIPLLIEVSFYGAVDKIVVVVAEQDTQISRLEKRYGIGREGALLRISSQLPTSEKVKHADWVITTDSSLEETGEQVKRVYSSAQKLLAQRK